MSRSPRTAGGVLPPLGRSLLALLLVVGIALVGVVLKVNEVGPFAPSSYTVDATFRDAGGVKESDHALVTIAGVDAGHVGSITHRDGRAILQLQLDDDTRGKIRVGATAVVRPRSQLGDLVVELTPGPRSGRPLEDGDRLGTNVTSASVPFSRVASTFDTDTRTWLQMLIGELDAGVGGDRRGRELQRAMRSLEPLAASASSVTGKLADRRTTLTRLVRDLDVLSTATGRRGTELRKAIVAARQVLSVTGDDREAVAASVRALPSTLAATRGALSSVTTLGDHLDPALTDLTPLTRELPGTLRTARETLPRADELLAEAGTTARTSTAPARALADTTRAAQTAIPVLRSPLRRGGSFIRSVNENKDGIGLLGERFSGIFSTADTNGTLLRGLGFFEPFNPKNFGFGGSPTDRAKAATLVVRATVEACRTNAFACLLPFTVPGLQDATKALLKDRSALSALRSGTAPAGSAGDRSITTGTAGDR